MTEQEKEKWSLVISNRKQIEMKSFRKWRKTINAKIHIEFNGMIMAFDDILGKLDEYSENELIQYLRFRVSEKLIDANTEEYYKTRGYKSGCMFILDRITKKQGEGK